MLQPIRTKFRKAFKGRIHGCHERHDACALANGLKALEPERVRRAKEPRAARSPLHEAVWPVWVRVLSGRASFEKAHRSAHG
jgi:large subunit ribosomal protein L16